MKSFKILVLVIISILLLTCALIAAPGDIISQFTTPGSCPTGLAYDGKYLWLSDRLSDTLYAVKPADGELKGEGEIKSHTAEHLLQPSFKYFTRSGFREFLYEKYSSGNLEGGEFSGAEVDKFLMGQYHFRLHRYRRCHNFTPYFIRSSKYSRFQRFRMLI